MALQAFQRKQLLAFSGNELDARSVMENRQLPTKERRKKVQPKPIEKSQMKRGPNLRWDVHGDLRGLGKRRSIKKAAPDTLDLSDISEEHFAPDWHWGPTLKQTGRVTAATAEYLLEYTFDQLRPPEADATVSTLDACVTYAPYLASTLCMEVSSGWETNLREFGRNRSDSVF